MKRSVKAYLLTRFRSLKWDDYGPAEKVDPLACWPDMQACVKVHYDGHPELRQHGKINRAPVEFECTERFLKSLDRYCTTENLKLGLIDALTKKIYGLRCSGLHDAPIKERNDLWHIYVSASWRVFYRKGENCLLFEEFGPHKKVKYCRRSRV